MSDSSSDERFRLAVLGLGHVGLPTALGFVEMGWEVIGADEDASKVAMIQSGKAPFYEPGLDDLLSRGLASGRLTSLTMWTRPCAEPRYYSFVSALRKKIAAKQT